MKKLTILLFSILISALATAHSGRTDSSGGHNNRSTGGYHYHNSGYSSSSSKSNYKYSKKTKQQLIDESIRSYPGSCPCPYSRARNGSRCGARSAWSKPGGYEPLCYESDIK